ncbi:hypothetical protein JHK87_025531 [Glycine soja]|nr:hypothetical protein JHK87_025531 [Glycine soja]
MMPLFVSALGVSGGPDSMALCVLTAGWKTAGADAVTSENGGFIDGLLAIIVDHGLRAESKEEANIVSHRVSKMGIRCEIACCDWPSGRPKQGQLQEAAREMRYQIFQEVCAQHRIGVLLIAHHADDQICQGGSENWVEDPTNQSPLYVRNRIRMVLNNLSSSTFKFELQALISACRITRTYVDQIGYSFIGDAVVIKDHGYAVIDLQILCPLKVEDICLMKFLSLVLQFVSQRQRQIRGNALKLLMDYIRTFPCKNSATAAGCYLCPDPGSRGFRVLVCCRSDDCALPSKIEYFESHSQGQGCCVANELGEIIEAEKSYANHLVLDASDVHFLDVNPELVLTEAKKLNIIGESTYNTVLALQKQETAHFRSKTEVISDSASKHGVTLLANHFSQGSSVT